MSKSSVGRARYTDAEDKLIKQLSSKWWSNHEISYQIFNKLGVERQSEALTQRRVRLIKQGYLEAMGPGKRYATKEALDWYNRRFGSDVGPSCFLELTEHKVRAKEPSGRKESGTRDRLVVAPESTSGSYTAQLLRIQRSSPHLLQLFRGLLEAGANESKTAPDIIDDLKEASA